MKMNNKMDTLKNLMSLIDANSEKIPEGEYLAMCEALKNLHGNVKRDPMTIRSVEYYDLEEELSRVTVELDRLHKERDRIHYRTKMTKMMKREVIREYAFTEGLHSLREYTPEALEEAGIHVNCNELYGKYLETFNDDIYQKKKVVHLNIQELRDYRDSVVKDLADVI
tara:strand:- start:495 stop:998 length:504 start_codon:yes stop_codon:yes gene_type:complete